MNKTSVIKVQDKDIVVVDHNGKDYISLTTMTQGFDDSSKLIGKWMTNKGTLEFLSIWESLNNPIFNYPEFGVIKNESWDNRFIMSVGQWVSRTNAVGIMAKSGKYGGTFAHKDIAFKFGSWLSPMFELLLIKEFQRLKDEEANSHSLEWDFRRFLAKVNYRVQTDAIKEVIIPQYKNLSQLDESYIYANNAEMINLVIFGSTSKQWKQENPKEALKNLTIRDFGNVPQLTVLANMESYHSELIRQGLAPKERLQRLKEAATAQLKTLSSIVYAYPIDSPHTLKYVQNSTFDNQLKGVLAVPPPPKNKEDKNH